jgi:hypothetical protein
MYEDLQKSYKFSKLKKKLKDTRIGFHVFFLFGMYTKSIQNILNVENRIF